MRKMGHYPLLLHSVRIYRTGVVPGVDCAGGPDALRIHRIRQGSRGTVAKHSVYNARVTALEAFPGTVVNHVTDALRIEIAWLHPVDTRSGRLDNHDRVGRAVLDVAQLGRGRSVGDRAGADDHRVAGFRAAFGPVELGQR